jgi:hypothetical protein
MKTLFLILGIITFTSCNSDDDTNAMPFEPMAITYTEIGKGALNGNGIQGIVESNMVITDDTVWESLLNQMDSYNIVSTNFTEIDIDFNNYIIIAVFLEVKPVNWLVEITNIMENEDNILVSQEDTEGGFLTIDQPYHIVKIPITDKPIVFE